jgi:prepilin signal peptidase PulO-like enzyme (type II secretory pathway)
MSQTAGYLESCSVRHIAAVHCMHSTSHCSESPFFSSVSFTARSCHCRRTLTGLLVAIPLVFGIILAFANRGVVPNGALSVTCVSIIVGCRQHL